MDLSKYTQRLKSLQEDARTAIQRVKEDGDLSHEAKTRKIGEIQSEFRWAYSEERKRATEQFENERRDAYRRAHPVEQPGNDTQGEILKELRRARVERDLFARWDNGVGPTLNDYQRVLDRGDTEEIEAYERHGISRATGDGAAQFKHQVRENQRSRMSEEQRGAVDELEELEGSEMEFGVAVAFVDRANDAISQSSVHLDSSSGQRAAG